MTTRKVSPAPKRTKTAGAAPPMSQRALGRATLARQMLLERAPLSVALGVERLAGLQAQWPAPPYVGLWTRLARFERGDLASAIADRTVVRATMMRATLHLVSAADYLLLRSTLQPMLSKAVESTLRERARGLDIPALVEEARECLAGEPRAFGEIRDFLVGRHPKLDDRAMGYAVRLHLPLVQVPGKGAWGFPSDPKFALADRWLGAKIGVADATEALFHRYLAAFGPATPRDFQKWSGVTLSAAQIARATAPLLRFTAEDGRELLDLPDAPRPPEDTPAPPRFLPEYDNLVLGHLDRTRVVPLEFRPHIFLSALRVRATYLVDGLARGAWKVERKKDAAVLVLEPFAPLAKRERAALVEEGERLVRFVEEGARSFAVRVDE